MKTRPKRRSPKSAPPRFLMSAGVLTQLEVFRSNSPSFCSSRYCSSVTRPRHQVHRRFFPFHAATTASRDWFPVFHARQPIQARHGGSCSSQSGLSMHQGVLRSVWVTILWVFSLFLSSANRVKWSGSYWAGVATTSIKRLDEGNNLGDWQTPRNNLGWEAAMGPQIDEFAVGSMEFSLALNRLATTASEALTQTDRFAFFHNGYDTVGDRSEAPAIHPPLTCQSGKPCPASPLKVPLLLTPSHSLRPANPPSFSGWKNDRLATSEIGMAEGVGFEPTVGFPTAVFKTAAINRSTTPPWMMLQHRIFSFLHLLMVCKGVAATL